MSVCRVSVHPIRPRRRKKLSEELSFRDRLKRALLSASARTSQDASDPRLTGRTYAIPFSRVWNAALDLVRGELPRWHARWWDEEAGVIQALSRGRFARRASDVVIRIRLDAQAQTRVDVRSTSRSKRVGDLGGNTRIIGVFIHALDRKLAAPPAPESESDGFIPEDAGPHPADAGGNPENPADDLARSHAAAPGTDDATEPVPPVSSGRD